MATNKKTTKKAAVKKTEKAVIVTKTKAAAKASLFPGKVKEMNLLLAKTTLISR